MKGIKVCYCCYFVWRYGVVPGNNEETCCRPYSEGGMHPIQPQKAMQGSGLKFRKAVGKWSPATKPCEGCGMKAMHSQIKLVY